MVNPHSSKSLNTRHTARGIVIKDNQLLLMERWRGDKHYFSIPGGGIEAGETPEDTVVREIAEETTVKIKTDSLAIIMEDGETRHQIYLCTYVSGEPELSPDSPEYIDMTEDNKFKPGWVDIDALASLPFVYWQPVKQPLIDCLKNGFPNKPIAISNEQ